MENSSPPKALKDIVGERVRALRHQHQLSVAELADLAGTTPTNRGGDAKTGYLYKLETGERTVNDVLIVLALAAALGVSPLVLLLPEDGNELIDLIPGREPVRAADAYAWFIGARSLPTDDGSEKTAVDAEVDYQSARARLHQLLPYINEITAKVAGIDVDSANIYELVHHITPKVRKDRP